MAEIYIPDDTLNGIVNCIRENNFGDNNSVNAAILAYISAEKVGYNKGHKDGAKNSSRNKDYSEGYSAGERYGRDQGSCPCGYGTVSGCWRCNDPTR